MANLVDLRGQGGNDWAKAEQILKDNGFNNFSSGVRNWVLNGDQGYGWEEAQRYGLPYDPTKRAGELAAQQKAESAAFYEKRKAEEQGFLSRFRSEFPTILSGIEDKLGLPIRREETRKAFETLKAIPGQVASRALGKDVSPTQLQRMQSNATSKYLPAVEDLTTKLQFAEEDYNRKATEALVPFQTEIDLLKDRLGAEAVGFTANMKNELDGFISALNAGVTMRAQDMNKAIELAKLEADKEKAKNEISHVDMGDKIGFFQGTNLISSFAKGLAPSKGTGTGNSGDMESYAATIIETLNNQNNQNNQNNGGMNDWQNNPDIEW